MAYIVMAYIVMACSASRKRRGTGLSVSSRQPSTNRSNPYWQLKLILYPLFTSHCTLTICTLDVATLHPVCFYHSGTALWSMSCSQWSCNTVVILPGKNSNYQMVWLGAGQLIPAQDCPRALQISSHGPICVQIMCICMCAGMCTDVHDMCIHIDTRDT